MTEQLISVGFGKGSFKTRSFSLSGFVLTPGFVRTTPNKVYKRQGQCQRFPISDHPEVNGYLYLDSVQAQEGAIILLQASHKTGGSPISDAAVLIALRSTGPMLGVKAKLPSAVESRIGQTFMVFQGRGDLLTKEELLAFGIEPTRQWSNAFLDPEEFDECYTVETIAGELTARRTLQMLMTEDGEAVPVQRAPGRRVRLR